MDTNCSQREGGRKLPTLKCLTGLLAAGLLLWPATGVLAWNAGWTQNDWAGGVDISSAVDPGDRTGWTKYQAKDTAVTTTGGLSLQSEIYSWTVTDNSGGTTGFSCSESFPKVAKSGSGAAAYLALAKYDASGSAWQSLAGSPASVAGGSALAYDETGGFIYALAGWSQSTFMRYSVSGNSWATMTGAPAMMSNGSGLVYPGSGDYVYASHGGNTNFFRYSISGNSWATMTSAPGYFSSMVYPGTGDYIYSSKASPAAFYRYSISGNSWATMTAPPTSIGGGLVYPGYGDFIYGLQGGGGAAFVRYSISGNSWATMTVPPDVSSPGNTLAYPGNGTFIYAIRNNNTTSFWRYSIPDNNWAIVPAATVSFSAGALASSSSLHPSYFYALQGASGGNFWRIPFSSNSVTGLCTSQVFNTGGQYDFYDISWSSFIPAAGGNIVVEARAGNTATPDGTWTTWQAFTNGESLGGAMDSRQYVQWRSSFTTMSTSTSPVVYDLTVRYQGYSSLDRSLVSSVYDSVSSSNSLRKLTWEESIPFPTDARFQLRTSPDGSAWTSWMGPGGTGASYFTDPAGGETIPYALRDGLNDRYYQYKALIKGGGSSYPIVSSATVTYGSLAIPDLTGLTPDSSTQITLDFADNSDEEDDFRIATAAAPGAANDVGTIVTADKPGMGAQAGPKTGLTPNTLYYFKLRSHETQNPGGGYSSYSNELSTYTLAAAPLATAAQYVPTINNIQVAWAANNNPAGTLFYPERATNSDFSTGLVQPGWTSQLNQTFASLALGTTYYFRVRAKNAYGIESATTALHSAQPVADPTVAVDSIYQVWTTSVTVKWDPNGNVSYIPYKAQRATDAGFTTNLADLGWVNTGGANSATLTGLTLNTQYYFRVKAANPSLDESAAWVTLGSTITLAAQPAAGTAFSIWATSFTNVNWGANGNTGGTLYRVQWSTSPDFEPNVQLADNAANPVVITGLLPLTTYYARVLAVNTASAVTEWRSLGSGYTKPRPSVYSSYAPLSSQITVNWTDGGTPPGQPVEWYAERATNTGFTTGLANSGWLSQGTTFYTFGGLAVSTQYYFRSRAREQSNPANVSEYGSYPAQATLPNAPASQAHAFVSSGTVTAQWGDNGNGGGTNYYAERALDAGFTSDVTNSGWITATTWKATVAPNTFYYFRVKARNVSLVESTLTSLPTVRSYANVPGGASVSGVLSDLAQFNWNLNSNPGGTEFWAEIALTSSPWTSISSAGWVTATSNLFTGLAENTTYYFKVKARNASMNEGLNSLAPDTPVWTTVISTRTPLPPVAPTALAVDLEGVSEGQTDRLHIKWNDNSNNEDNFKLERGPDTASFAPVLDLSVNTTEYLDTGLEPNTSYFYRVKAYSGGGGESAYTNIGSLYTRAAAPTAVLFNLASSVTARISWNANGNPAGTQFTAQLSTMADISPVLDSYITAASPASFSGLTPNTTHYGRLKAVNGNGVDSDYSAIASSLTAAAPPDSPAFLSLWVTSMSVTWGANSNPSYTRYTAELSTAADYSGTLVSSATKNYWAELTPLAPNTTWYFRVRAFNEEDSAAAYSSPAEPAATLAQDPGVSAASYLVNSSSVTVFWDTVNNPAWTQYNVQRSGKDSSNFASVEDSSMWQTGRSSWTFYAPSLSAGGTYYFRIKARNSAGTEAPSGAGNWIVLPSTQTLANMPGLVPADVFVSSINARWVNTNAAGTPYLAEISEQSDYSVIAASSGWLNDIASYAFTGLASDTRYYIRVRARNTSGIETGRLQLYNEYTRAAEPGQPTGAYARSGNSVTLNWDKNGNPDPGTEYFSVASSSSDFSFNTSSSPWATANSYQFNGLLPGATYYFRAKARNRNAVPLETGWTILPSTSTLPAPAPPSGIDLAYPDAFSTDRLNVLWNDNSSDEAGFRVYESVNGTDYSIKDTLGNNPGTGPLSYLAMALSPNLRYYYKVAAFNANGEAYTLAVSTYSRAAQPAALALSEVLTNSLRSNWGVNSNPAGTVYVTEVSTMAGFVPLTASSSTLASEALLAGLEANKVYYARVKAVNGSGAVTDYTALGSTQTIPLSITITAADQAPADITQASRLSFAKVVVTPSGNGAQLANITVRRTGTGADADVSRVSVWRDQNADGGFQAGTDQEVGWGVFSGSQSAIAINQTFSAPTTFFMTLSAADNYLSWPGNTLGVNILSTASFTSPNSLISTLAPSPFSSGQAPLVKLADTLDIFGTNAAPMPNVSRGIYNTAFLKLTLSAARDRAYLNNLTVNKLGTLADGYIEAVKVFYDTNENGTLEATAGDSLISSGIDTFSGGQTLIQLVNPSTRAVSNEVYFITLDIIDTAPLNATVGLRVANAAAFTLMAGTPDSLTLAASPTDSSLPAVSDPPNTLMVTPTSMGVTTIEQGAEKAFEKLELTADSGNAVVTSLKVQRSSTSVDADYTRVALYRDNSPLGEYGPSDSFISSGVFSAGQATFGIAENITYTSTKTYFVVANVSASANTSNKAGVSIQAGYITVISAQTTISAPFPIYSGLAVITPTVDTVTLTPDASIAPSVVYQTNTDVPVLALKLQANANAADISSLILNQAGSALDADISSVRVFRDTGNGLFNPAQDTPVSGNYGFSNGSATISFSALQTITPSSVTYFVAANIAAGAVPGRTLQLRIATAGSFNILAPDTITSTFPVLSNSITLEKLPAVIYVSSASLAPASAGAGTPNIQMEKLLIRTNQSTSVMNSVSLVRAGGGDADLTGVALYWDANTNATLEPSELVSSGVFTGGFLSLPFSGSASNLSISTKTYYVTMDISSSAAVNTTLSISFTNLSVNSPDAVEGGRFPFASGSVLVAEPASQLLCALENKMPATAVQGDSSVLVASMTFRASAYTVDLTGIQLLRTGNGYDTDTTAVKLYRDNGNATWGGPAQETLVAAGSFASGAVSLSFSTETISWTSSAMYYIAVDVSETAVPGKTFGVTLPSASYLEVTDPDYADITAFPFDSSLTVIQPTVDTLQAVPVPLSLAPLLTQGDYRRSIGKLTLRSDAHSIELSGIRFDQSGTIPDADLAEALLYKDDGDGIFVQANDELVTFPTQLNAHTLQFLLSPAQVINTTPQTYWLAISVSSTAAVGTTLSLDCPSTSYFSVTVPDTVETTAFPFSFAVAGTLLDRPDTVRVQPQNTAPAEADPGSSGNVMTRLKVWTNEDSAMFSRLRVDLSGSVAPADISAVSLHKDLDSNGVLSGPDLLLSSAAFSVGYVWLELTVPQTVTVATQTYFVSYNVAPGAAINAVARAGLAAASYFDVDAPDAVDGSSLPFTSGGMTIREPAAQVSLNFENKASTWALQGQMDVLMSSFTLSVSSYNAQLTQLITRRTGDSPDADIAVYLYTDNGNGTFGGFAQETLVASAAFSGGMAALQFSPVSLSAAAPKLFYLAAKVADGALPGRTAGFSLDAANYVSLASPDYLDPALVFPLATGAFLVQATVDTLIVQAETASLVPMLTQADRRRAVGKLTLSANVNSVELSGIKFSQGGTVTGADLPEALLYKDDGDGVFVSTADAAVTLPTQLSGQNLQLMMLSVQTITTAPQVYWLALSVDTNAAVGATVSLSCPNTTYFTISAPDQVGTAPFPFTLSPAGSIQDKPDLLRVLPQNTAPAEADPGSSGNVMTRLKVWTDSDQAVFSRLRVDLSGSVAPADMSAVSLHKDLDANGVLSGPDLLLSSAAFGAGYVWLALTEPQTVTVATQTYFVSYTVAPGAAINAVAIAGLASASYLDVGASDSVDGSGLPFTSGGMTIREPAAQVSVNFENKASTWAIQGQTDVLMSSFTLSVATYNAQLTQLITRKTGTSPDADISVFLYADNGNGTFGGLAQETLVASAAFSGGMAALQFSPVSLTVSPKLFYLAAKVADGAQPGKTAGFSLDAANYVSLAAPDYLDPALVFPLATGAFTVQATVDTLIVQAETSSLVPMLTQADRRRAVGKLTLSANANSVELSGIKFSQGGTVTGADLPEALLYKDDGDGVFVSTADAAVTLPTQLSGSSLQLMMLSVQTITTSPQVYWLALSVDTNAAVGATVNLSCPNTTYFTISAPDQVGTAPFPFTLSPAGSIQDKPDLLRVLPQNTAPAEADQGSSGNVMARLKVWTDSDQAVLSRLRVDLAGSAAPLDITAVSLHKDLDANGVLSGPDLLLSSAAFGAGYAWLALTEPQTVTVATQTYFISYGVTPGAAINAVAIAGLASASYLDVGASDSVDGSSLPFTSGGMTIREPAAPVSLNFENKASTWAIQGQTDVLMSSFTLSVAAYNAQLTQLITRKTGTSPDADISVFLYADNGNGTFGGLAQETLVASAAFSGGMATLQFSPVNLTVSPKLFYLAAKVADGALPGRTAGFSLDAANYVSLAAPDYLDPALVFPLATGAFLVQATVDTLIVQAETASLVPMLTQADHRRAVGKLTLRANANSVELSGIRFSQGGTATGADLPEALIYKDDGDGVFVSTADTAVTLPTQLSGQDLQLLMLSAQTITTAPQVYWLALSVATDAAVGATVNLNCTNAAYFTLAAPDQAGTALFPFTISPAGSIQDKPDTLRLQAQNTAPSAADQGSVNNLMIRLKLWTDSDRAVLNRVRVNLTGSAAGSDIAAVTLYRDADLSGALSAPDVLLASSAFSGGSAWLNFSAAQTITAATQTYLVAYNISASAASGVQARAEISGAASLEVDSPDVVDTAGLPFSSGLLTVNEPPALLSLNFEDKASTSAVQGRFDLLLASFTVTVSAYNAQLTQLLARRTGTGIDSDAVLYLYADDGDGAFGGYGFDNFLSSAAFSGSVAALPFSPVSMNAAAPKRFFLAAALAYGAQPYRTFGISLDAAGYFSVAAPDYIDPALVFPLVTAPLEIRPTSDTLIAAAEALNMSPLLTQGDSRRAVARLTLRADANSVEVSNIRLTRTGTMADAAVTEALLYKDDGDGVFVSTRDTAVTLPAVFANGELQLVLSPAQAVTTAPQAYWLALSVDTLAAPGATLSLAAPGTGYFTVSSPDGVDPAAFPLSMPLPGSIQDKPDTVQAALSDLASTSIYQGLAGNLMAKVRLWTDQDSAVMSMLRVDLTGSAPSADVSAVKLYADTDGDGAFDAAADTLLAAGSFLAGNIWLTPAPQTITASTRTYFITYDIAAAAAIDSQMGLSVTGVSYFNVDSPDLLGSLDTFSTKLAVIRDPRVPVPPGINMVRGDGTLSLDEVSYNPYETMLSFKWDGAVYQGAIEKALYYVGPAPGVSTSPWTSVGLTREISLGGLDLAQGGTYYLSLRAKNMLGNYVSDIVSRKFLVDSFRPVMPAPGTVKSEASGIKLEWPQAVVGPSGLVYYRIEERRGDSPVWTVISTTTEKTLVISQAGVTPQSLVRAPGSYYYRVSAVNGAGVTGAATEPLAVNVGLDRLAAITGLSAYPNPFDSRKRTTTIAFTLNQASAVDITIYDIFGLKVRKIRHSGAAGANDVIWDGKDNAGAKVSKGMYLCVIKAIGDRKVIKVGVIH